MGLVYKNLIVAVGLAAMATGCSNGDTSYSLLSSGQSFKQATVNTKVDILWVVDNSGSMKPLQDNMTANFNSFISQFVTKGYDFHLSVVGTDAYKAEILSSRVVGTRGIVGAIAAAARRPAVLVSASGIGYYGHRDETPLDEYAPAGRDFVAEVCVAWEREAARAEELGVRVARVRTGLVLDPGAGALGQLLLPFRLRAGGPIMPGSQYYSWIHPDDEVGVILLALEDERLRGPVNATAPTPATNRDFCATLGAVLGSPSWLPVPEFSLRIALGEMADLVTTGQRVLPRRVQELGYSFKHPELRAALRDLLGP